MNHSNNKQQQHQYHHHHQQQEQSPKATATATTMTKKVKKKKTTKAKIRQRQQSSPPKSTAAAAAVAEDYSEHSYSNHSEQNGYYYEHHHQKLQQQQPLLSKTQIILLILIVAMIIVITMQFYFIFHDDDMVDVTATSIHDVFPDFVTSLSASKLYSSTNISSINDHISLFQKQHQNKIISTARNNNDKNNNPIFKILTQAGYDINDKTVFTDEVMSLLPDWNTIVEFYGPPVIVGLETCQRFRDSKPRRRDRLISIAGTFNSGTNFLNDVIHSNCYNPDLNSNMGSGIRWQVPWGKHFPVEYRGINAAPRYGKAHINNVLPVVTIRDPYTWMSSMCRQNYAALFDHEKTKCPNLYPYQSDIDIHPRYGRMKYIPVHVKYDNTNNDVLLKHQSLGHLWNDFYGAYVFQNTTTESLTNTAKKPNFAHPGTAPPDRTNFPRLLVRMEDVIFHADIVIPKICECAGFVPRQDGDFTHMADTSNLNPGIEDHIHVEEQRRDGGSSQKLSGLLRSVIKYGNVANRKIGYPNFQLKAAKEVLDPTLMELFQYKYESYDENDVERW